MLPAYCRDDAAMYVQTWNKWNKVGTWGTFPVQHERCEGYLELDKIKNGRGIGFTINPLPVSADPRSSSFDGLSSKTQRSSW
jgi:hypothetical protein